MRISLMCSLFRLNHAFGFSQFFFPFGCRMFSDFLLHRLSLIDSSLNIIFPLISAEKCTKKGLTHIFFSVHHVNVVWKSKVFEIGEIPKAWLVGPGVFRIISQEIPWPVRIRL